jgi:hypothetical protein
MREGNKRIRGAKHERYIGKETIGVPDSDRAGMERSWNVGI